MTPREVQSLLFNLKWAVEDAGYSQLAGGIEDVEMLFMYGITVEQTREYADLLLPPGKKGRVRLVLSRPYEARVYAFLVGLLRSWPVL
jgi:hypothetical protein